MISFFYGARRMFEVAAPAIIGRINCDVNLAMPYISRRHAEFATAESGWTIRDLNSANGTYVNGERVKSDPVAIKDGDVIGLGYIEYTIRFSQEAA